MMKTRVVIIFIIAQVALVREHASRRSVDTVKSGGSSHPMQPEHRDAKFAQHVVNVIH